MKGDMMTDYTVMRLALVLAMQAEIEGMKAENIEREQTGKALAYGEAEFDSKAIELMQLAYKHDEQL